MAHAMQQIAQRGMTPVAKAASRRTSEATEGVRFARDVIEQAEQANATWLDRGMTLVRATKQFRAAALDVWQAYREEMREYARANVNKDDKAKAMKQAASATTRVAELAAIASAWNSGASENGLAQYMGELPGHPNMSWGVLLAYARTFSDSKAGRPVNSTLQNLVGFIVREGKRDNLTPEDKRILESLTQWAQGQGAKFK